MAGWIKMPLGMEVGLGSGDFVLDQAPPSPKIGVEVGLGPGHIVRDGTQLLSPKRGQSPPIFRPSLLRPNGWMHQDATW